MSRVTAVAPDAATVWGCLARWLEHVATCPRCRAAYDATPPRAPTFDPARLCVMGAQIRGRWLYGCAPVKS